VITDVEQRLLALVVQQTGRSADTITDASDLRKDLGADSMDILELQMSIEEIYNIEINDNAMKRIRTFGALVEVVGAGVSNRLAKIAAACTSAPSDSEEASRG